MVELVSGVYDFQALPVEKLWEKDGDNVLAFKRRPCFRLQLESKPEFHGLWLPCPAGEYEVVLDSDSEGFGGYNLLDDSVHHFTQPDPLYSPQEKAG